MDAEKSSLNPSSLLDLKAELHKKYDLFQRAKLSQKSDSSRSTAFKYKGKTVSCNIKNAPKSKVKSNEENSEEDLALKKSQLALEAKARLYEKITSNNILIDDEDNERYLVDFHRKVLYTPMPDKAEEIEKCPPDSEENSTPSKSSKFFEDIYKQTPVISPKETSRLDENQPDQPVHYQNVQFNEVRDHGTGYFQFSMDESKRKEQMEQLNQLRKHTENQRLIAQRMQRKRKALLEARLVKICERRNIDKGVVQAYTKTPENTDDVNQEEVADISSIPLPKTPDVPEKKEVKTRPWDIGKTNLSLFVPEKHKTKSQNNWIEDRRSERVSEFAPPSSYK